MDPWADGGYVAFRGAAAVCRRLPVRGAGDDFCRLGVDVPREYAAHAQPRDVTSGAVDSSTRKLRKKIFTCCDSTHAAPVSREPIPFPVVMESGSLRPAVGLQKPPRYRVASRSVRLGI